MVYVWRVGGLEWWRRGRISALQLYLVELGGQGVCSLLPLGVAHGSQQAELELVVLGGHLVLGRQLHEGDGVVCLHCDVALLRLFLWLARIKTLELQPHGPGFLEGTL